ncbi:DNA-binding protein [Aeromonas salmonicida]|uniref:DNA-binding protein n=1 Tax=Aeromonas salmonicida TaxID=645 RepID=UPI003D19AAC3
MSTWYTAQVLAGLVGMPAYPDGVRKKAEREEWQSRRREKGKGAEYHIGSLPIHGPKRSGRSRQGAPV